MDTIYPVITKADIALPFYVTGVGCQRNQEYIHRPLGFNNYQWAYCRSGKGILEIDGTECVIDEKCGFFFRSGVPHKYYAIEEPWEVQWLTFDGRNLSVFMDYLGYGMWEVAVSLNIEYLDKMVNNIYLTLKSGKRFNAAECSLLLYDFLLKMRKLIQSDESGGTKGDSLILDKVVKFMEDNFSYAITLDDIAKVASITPSHLCRIFKKRYGMSVFKFLTNLRVQKSKEMLMKFPGMAIKEVAERAGFNDTSYFCMVFKKFEGITPSEFRGG
ncbi:MAG TPA: AraC family transcriptional regulator [Clostridiaceae bacterium]|nr:AraC family transcriptional regulator [Clostridiaceae bacterium]